MPSNENCADHIENTSCNAFSIVADAYFGRCLEMGLHVTVSKNVPRAVSQMEGKYNVTAEPNTTNTEASQ
jgi:hypothetical protein